MKTLYLELAQRIYSEIPDLEHTINRALRAWSEVKKKTDYVGFWGDGL